MNETLHICAGAKACPDGMRGALHIKGYGKLQTAVWLFDEIYTYVPASLQSCISALNRVRRNVPIRFRTNVHSIYFHMSRNMIPRTIPEWDELSIEAGAFTNITWIFDSNITELDALFAGELGGVRKDLSDA